MTQGRLNHEALRGYLEEKIAAEKMSPGLVAGGPRIHFSEGLRMQIGRETIYPPIFSNRL
jgi:hypothetical protein